jgi:hypothetical protein
VTLFSYVVRWDIGFAPNPFHGVCTLATCKQDIRRIAQRGDWIVGTGSRPNGKAGDLVFGMKVDEIVSFDEYWADTRFASKKPNLRGSRMQQFGDNIYHHSPDGAWVQENSRHSKRDGSPEPRHIQRDTGRTDQVLLGREFVYFGGDGPPVPPELRDGYGFDLVHDRPAFRNSFGADQIAATADWLQSLDQGLQGRPYDWPRPRSIARAA